MRRSGLVLAGVLLAAAAGACGSAAQTAVSETIGNLSEIRSGNLDMSLSLGTGEGGEDTVGFDLSGPFALPEREGELPDAEITYTQRAGLESSSVTLRSSADGAIVEADGSEQEIPPEGLADLRAASAPGSSPIDGSVSDWFRNASFSDASEEESVEIVRGDLDVAHAVRGLAAIVNDLDGGVDQAPVLENVAEDLPDEATGTFELSTGKEDRLLHSLAVQILLPLDEEARRLLSATGAQPTEELRLDFDLTIQDPNRPG